MKRLFHILGSDRPRPASRQTIFCDGSADETYREEFDIELSHWMPNATPAAFAGETSTEIALNFAARTPSGSWDLAINNHLDVDGVLSVFAAIDPTLAVTHRETLIAAAEMGDFQGWGTGLAAVLFQSLSLLIDDFTRTATDIGGRYQRALELTESILTGTSGDDPRVEAGLASLGRSVGWLDDGQIRRHELSRRFVHYEIPATLGSEESRRHAPGFGEPLSNACVLWPHARAREDAERIQLVSAEARGGVHYDVHYPGYMWADTKQLWRPPGLEFSGSTNGHFVGYEPLREAVVALNQQETAQGEWRLAKKMSPFEGLQGRRFPIVVSFVGLGERPSELSPDYVAGVLTAAFREI